MPRITIVGGGLIGSSLALALQQGDAPYTIAMLDRNAGVAARIRDLGICADAGTDPAVQLAGADIVIFCVPVLSMEAAAESCAPHVGRDAVITDAGSVKGTVIDTLRRHFPSNPIVPGHPIAGTENSGPDAAFASLFTGRLVLLTEPIGGADPADADEAQQAVAALWTRAGAEVRTIPADRHDQVYALVSHMPHAVSYALARCVAAGLSPENRDAGGGALRDMTRIAGSNPVMWRDIFLANREALVAAIEQFEREMAQMKAVIRTQDGAAIARYIEDANAAHATLKTPPAPASSRGTGAG